MHVLMRHPLGRHLASSGRFPVHWLRGMWPEGADITSYSGSAKFSLLPDGPLRETQRGCRVLCITALRGAVARVDNTCHFAMRKAAPQRFYASSDQPWLSTFFSSR